MGLVGPIDIDLFMSEELKATQGKAGGGGAETSH